jgi:hypothetical protein
VRQLLIVSGIVLLLIVVLVGAAAGWIGFRIARTTASPTPTPLPPPSVTVEQVRQAAELATVKFALSTDITSTRVPEDIRQVLGVKEEVVLIAYGEVAAGFDLSTLGEGDLWTDGTRVQHHLPAPQILYSRLDNERTHVVYYSRSLLIDHDLTLEGKARQQAEDAIRQAALESDILRQAGTYGELFFSNWLYSMGYSEVRVIVD